ncbi:hypothetical protein OSB04_019664 [Centaurea solstitialis]|uniref:Reverse transcriptase domain-containing protein n=1 Tax=Centaurea solstitialis TaxID=347529 RepID=A0AA38T286_9ASTR|nr:hypothetical protein OSB04_019664 [Centaurea solstitialis]
MEDSVEDAMDLIVSGSSHLGATDTTVVVEDVGSDVGSDNVDQSGPDKTAADKPALGDSQNIVRTSVFDRLEVDPRLKIPKVGHGNKSFADAVGSTDTEHKNLEFFPLADKSQCRVKIPVELAKRASMSFITTACGYFLGPRLQFSVVKRFASSQWDKFGFIDAMLNENGIFFFKFETEGGALQVVNLGSVMINGVPFFLLPWDPTRGISKPQHKSCPLWVKIHNIPLVAFNNEGISRIASALGIPIRMDACTSSMCDKAWGRPGFAKVLIDVWAVGELKRELQIVIPSLSGGSDTTVILKVEYLWEPIQCTHCMVFGHRTSSCPKAVIVKKDKGKAPLVDEEGFQKVITKKWVPKHVAAGVDASHSGAVSKSAVTTDVGGAKPTSGAVLSGNLGKSSGGSNPTVSTPPLVGQASASPAGGGTASVSTPPPEPSYVRFTRGSSDPSFKQSVLQNSKFIAKRGTFIPDKPDGPGVKEVLKSNAFDVLSDLGDVELAGLNAPIKQVEVRDCIRSCNLSFCALVETHVQQASLPTIVSSVFGSWKWTSNAAVSGRGARILFAWDERVADVMVWEFHSHDVSFFATIVYGSNSLVERNELWSGLRKAKVIMGDKPWVVLGDFNAMLFPHDGFGGCSKRNQSMEDFFLCVEDTELFDVRYTGVQFTWTQKPRGGEGLLRKLDRVLVNTSFLTCFPDSSANFIPRGVSDHACAVLEMPAQSRPKQRGFRFENFLADRGDFLDIVASEWYNQEVGSFMFSLVKRLKRLKKPFRRIRNLVGDVTVRVRNLRIELDAIQLACDLDPSNSILMEDLAHITLAYEQARADELAFFRQRAKVRWLNEGDRNTAYFHQVVKERRNRGILRSVIDSQGRYVQDDAVGPVFVDHFRSFLGMIDPLVEPSIQSDLFQNSLTLSESLHMIRPILDEEIKWAVFNIGNDKAPGPDGYSSKFFKSAWSVIGKDVLIAVHNFFYSGRLLSELNHTLLCFIPKVPNATRVTDFRPISCCNVLYKVISKVVAERMKPYLSQLIGPDQSAFIPGRRISDNILMAHELVAGYQRNSGRPRCAFKIDLRKAYDTVDWRFLLRMLQGLGFHPVFCKWIDQMLRTSSFSIALNGETFGFFKGARGLRQGDPISPYLFTIVMECFSLILKRCIAEADSFTYHQGCDELDITHLCFADDLFVFTGGDLASVEVLKVALDRFRKISGLEPNIEKSDAFFCNVSIEDREVILNCLPFKPGCFPIRYLGVPLSPMCLRLADFAPLVTKVKTRIHNWKAKFLSFAGRKQLIVSVLQSMQLYWMAIYVLPSGVVHELESCFRDFLWAQGDSSKGKCKIAWDTVCKPISSGGLGFKRLSLWNRAFIAKHIWDLITRRNSLWVNWIWRYCIREHSFWLIKPTTRWSWVFRKILDIRDSVREFFFYQIGSGYQTNAWADSWMEAGPLSSLIPYRRFTREGFHVDTRVRDLIDVCNGVWPIAWSELDPIAFSHPMPNPIDTDDVVRWRGLHGAGVDFSVREACCSLLGPCPSITWTKYVWFKGHIPKVSFCLWTACHGRLPTQDRVNTWLCSQAPLCCVLCSNCMDSHDHLFFDCLYSKEVWRRLKKEYDLFGYPELWSTIMATLNDNRGPRRLSHRLALSSAVYHIWKERNRRMFQGVKQQPIVLFKMIRDQIDLRLASWKLGTRQKI